MRTFFRVLLCIIAGVVLLLGYGVTIAWWTAGTPANAASTVVSLLGNDQAAASAGALFVDQIIDSADAKERQSLEAERDELAAAAGRGLQQASTQAGEIVAVALTAIAQQTDVKISMNPVLDPVFAQLHATDSQIPAQAEGDQSIDIKGSELGALSSGVRGLGLWWTGVLLGILLLVGAAFAGRPGGWRRWRGPGITLAVVGLAWLAVGLSSPRVVGGFADNTYQAELIRSASSQVAGHVLVVSGVSLVVGIVLFAMSLRRRQERAAPVAPADSGPEAGEATPVASVAN